MNTPKLLAVFVALACSAPGFSGVAEAQSRRVPAVLEGATHDLTVHPHLRALRTLLDAQMTPAERLQLAAVNLSSTERGDPERLLLAMLDHLRPALVGALEAVGHRSTQAVRLRSFSVRSREDALALGDVLEAAGNATLAEADAEELAPVDSENPLRGAASITLRAAELATVLGRGIAPDDEPEVEDALLEVVTLLDQCTAFVGRPAGSRLALGVLRAAADAARTP